jgi:adenosylcobyric acid synthase
LREYVDRGGRILGICGGYQMLGEAITDPAGAEGDPGTTLGLGLLPVTTELLEEKTLTRTRGTAHPGGQRVDGYEIHMGVTRVAGGVEPMLRVCARNGIPCDEPEGARSGDGRIAGTYLHGLFDEPGFRHDALAELCPELARRTERRSGEDIRQFKDRQYDLLAEHVAAHLNLPLLARIAGVPRPLSCARRGAAPQK